MAQKKNSTVGRQFVFSNAIVHTVFDRDNKDTTEEILVSGEAFHISTGIRSVLHLLMSRSEIEKLSARLEQVLLDMSLAESRNDDPDDTIA